MSFATAKVNNCLLGDLQHPSLQKPLNLEGRHFLLHPIDRLQRDEHQLVTPRPRFPRAERSSFHSAGRLRIRAGSSHKPSWAFIG